MEDINIKKIFAQNIKRLRKNRKLTQEQFAELIGMQWKSIVNFETGRNLASPESLQKICKTLEIEPFELFLTSNSDNSTQNIINKINIILKTNEEKLEEIYRVIAVLCDKNRFME